MRTLSLSHALEGRLVLEGAGSARPFLQARYLPRASSSGQVEDQIDLLLESNSPADIAQGVSSLERLLHWARALANDPLGEPVYLTCRDLEGEEEWRSPLRDGWLELTGGQRSHGSVGARLHLRRDNYWEAAEAPLPLSNRNASRTTQPLLVYNHHDGHSGHDNFAEIAASDVSGDQPAPVRLELTNLAGGATTCVWVGLDQHRVGGQFFSPWLEAETGLGAVPLVDPTCSGEAQVSLSWSGTQVNELLRWTVASPQPDLAAGRFFQGILRLAGGGSQAGDLWLRTRLELEDSVIWEGAWVLIPVNQELVELNLLPLPPLLAGMGSLAGLDLVLQGYSISGGMHSLQVDYLHLTPLDGWRKLVSVERGLPEGSTLYEDGFLGEVYTGFGSLFSGDFTVYGDPIFIIPGKAQRLYILQSVDVGQAPAGRTLQVKAAYRPRKRQL